MSLFSQEIAQTSTPGRTYAEAFQPGFRRAEPGVDLVESSFDIARIGGGQHIEGLFRDGVREEMPDVAPIIVGQRVVADNDFAGNADSQQHGRGREAGAVLTAGAVHEEWQAVLGADNLENAAILERAVVDKFLVMDEHLAFDIGGAPPAAGHTPPTLPRPLSRTTTKRHNCTGSPPHTRCP